MEAVVIFGALALAVNKTISVIKAALSGETNTWVTQLVVWVVGFCAVSLAAHASLTEDLAAPGLPVLSSLDWASLVMLGWVLGSSGSFAFDLKKAVDASDSAVEPKLLN